jgi:ribulose-phosphate 3-epimerase
VCSDHSEILGRPGSKPKADSRVICLNPSAGYSPHINFKGNRDLTLRSRHPVALKLYFENQLFINEARLKCKYSGIGSADGHPVAEAEDKCKTLFEDHAMAWASSFCTRSKALLGHRGAKPCRAPCRLRHTVIFSSFLIKQKGHNKIPLPQRTIMPIIAPSLLASDFANIQRECEMLNESEADWFHIDVMDGVFVPNISFGLPVLKAMKKHAQKPMDVHLMIVQPERYIKDFKEAGADILTVHYEASTHLHRSLQAIKAEGMQAGVAINPHTPVHLLKDVIKDIDLVCMMSVNPGFGGQKFIDNTYNKVTELRSIIDTAGAGTKIEIDGGVTSENASKLVKAGADVLVAGSFVFRSENPKATIAELKKS